MKIKSTTEHKDNVRSFFDKISNEYQGKYETSRNKFLSYFFLSRLEAATKDVALEGKKILDVGAGTGPLYDYLTKKNIKANYFASDISSKMLGASNIPTEQYFIGSINEQDFPEITFDIIYVLGVTTYMSKEEMESNIIQFKNKLNPNGKLIISYTNHSSIEVKLRKIINYFIKFFGYKRSVIGQSFKIFTYCYKEAKSLFEDDFKLSRVVYLNHTFTPLNRIFPNFSIWMDKKIRKNIKAHSFISVLSSDFLFFFEKK